MATLFYDHLIPWAKVDVYVQTLDVAGDDRVQILAIIEETIHTETLLVILSYLPKKHHESFIERFHAKPHDTQHLIFLKQTAHPEIEQHIREALEKVVAEIVAEKGEEEMEE